MRSVTLTKALIKQNSLQKKTNLAVWQLPRGWLCLGAENLNRPTRYRLSSTGQARNWKDRR